jgi:hypothetical protein
MAEVARGERAGQTALHGPPVLTRQGARHVGPSLAKAAGKPLCAGAFRASSLLAGAA